MLMSVLMPNRRQAETYKWLDANGQTHYSSAPPPAGQSAKSVKTVEDRISVYPPDPTLKDAAAHYRRMDMAETEWLQRQQLMARAALQSQRPAPSCNPYRSDCSDPRG